MPESTAAIIIALIGFAGIVVGVVGGYMGRARVDSRNGKSNNPGGLIEAIRADGDKTRGELHGRLDRLEDKVGDGFKDVCEILGRIEVNMPRK